MPAVNKIKENAKYLSLNVVRFIAEQALELQSAVVDSNCKYVDIKNSLEHKLNVARDIWAKEVLSNDDEAYITLRALRRIEQELASVNTQFTQLERSDMVQVAELFIELNDDLLGPDPVAFVGLVPGDDDTEAQDFVSLANYLARDALAQANADEPMPALDLPAPIVPVAPVVPQAARRPMAEVVDSGSDEDVPEVLLPLRADAQVPEEKKDNDDHFLTDPRNCRRRILKGRGAKTYADDQGVIRLNTRTVEAHLSRNARAKKYPADAGLVRLLNIFKERIEDRIEEDYGDRCTAVSFSAIFDVNPLVVCSDQDGEAPVGR
jgi:hypothetical protein